MQINTESPRVSKLLSPSKIQGMTEEHGLGRACGHIKALDSPKSIHPIPMSREIPY